jgi:hypothetical protein
MPGHHISDQQVFLFMTHRRQHTQAVANDYVGDLISAGETEIRRYRG